MLIPLCATVSLLAAFAHAQSTTSLPPQSELVTTLALQGNGRLPPVSYSYPFTVTTATTAWADPSFQTAAPVPECSETMCPKLDHQTCIDPQGHEFGIICDTLFIGTVITTSGKHKRVDEERDMEEAALAASSLGERDAEPEADASLEDREIYARTYTRTFVGCADACGMVKGCVGMSFNAGYAGNCQSLSRITGSFPAPGQITAIKLDSVEFMSSMSGMTDD